MKHKKIEPNSFTDVRNEYNAKLDLIQEYILKYGTKNNSKGKRVLDIKFIYPKPSVMFVKASFFKNKFDLLPMLCELSLCERSALLRATIENVVAKLINFRSSVNFEGIDFFLEDDLKRIDDNGTVSERSESDEPEIFF